jgi:hypothetical protein
VLARGNLENVADCPHPEHQRREEAARPIVVRAREHLADFFAVGFPDVDRQQTNEPRNAAPAWFGSHG